MAGPNRRRCKAAGKVKFYRVQAFTVATRLGLRSYLCPHCRWWHVTSKAG